MSGDDRSEIIDQCESCGQETEYHCSRVGGKSVCERCYRIATEAVGL